MMKPITEKREFSLAQLTVLNTSPPEIAGIAARCGYDYFSMRQIYMGLPEEPDFDLTKNRKLLEQTKHIMAETGIRLLDIELARITDSSSPTRFEPAFSIAEQLGGKHVISSIWTDNRDLYLEQLAETCDLAAKYNLTVELEYVPIAAVKNLRDALEVLDMINRPNAGLLVDIHHFQRASDSLDELASVPRNLFHFVHLCDTTVDSPDSEEELRRIMREDRDYLGEGGAAVQDILDAMPDVPYSIELPKNSVSSTLGYEAHAKRCIDTAKSYLEKRGES